MPNVKVCYATVNKMNSYHVAIDSTTIKKTFGIQGLLQMKNRQEYNESVYNLD